MSTLVPHPSTAITLGYLHGAVANHILPATTMAGHSGGAVAVLVVVLGLAFLASVIGLARQIAALMSLLLQTAASVGAALVIVLIVAGLAIIALLH
jgi:malonyl CoA-acyl carrier protein transacylase